MNIRTSALARLFTGIIVLLFSFISVRIWMQYDQDRLLDRLDQRDVQNLNEDRAISDARRKELEKRYQESIQNREAGIASRSRQEQREKEERFFEAANKADRETFESMLSNGWDINHTNSAGHTSLITAAMNGNSKAVQMLLSLGANPGIQDQFGHTAWLHAASRGDLESLKLLQRHGSDVNAGSDVNNNALHRAVLHGKADVIRYLLEKGVKVNSQNDAGNTPLHMASRRGQSGIVRLMLDKGADLKVRNNIGNTPLHQAAGFGDVETVRILVDRGSNIRATNQQGLQAVQLAAAEGQLRNLQLLASKGADLRIQNDKRMRLLHFAVMGGQDALYGDETTLPSEALTRRINLVKYLLAQGENVNAEMENNFTPLHLAVHGFRVEDRSAYYPLQSPSDRLAMVRTLLAAGADARARDSTPLVRSAADYARMQHQDEIVKVLEAAEKKQEGIGR